MLFVWFHARVVYLWLATCAEMSSVLVQHRQIEAKPTTGNDDRTVRWSNQTCSLPTDFVEQTEPLSHVTLRVPAGPLSPAASGQDPNWFLLAILLIFGSCRGTSSLSSGDPNARGEVPTVEEQCVSLSAQTDRFLDELPQLYQELPKDAVKTMIDKLKQLYKAVKKLPCPVEPLRGGAARKRYQAFLAECGATSGCKSCEISTHSHKHNPECRAKQETWEQQKRRQELAGAYAEEVLEQQSGPAVPMDKASETLTGTSNR